MFASIFDNFVKHVQNFEPEQNYWFAREALSLKTESNKTEQTRKPKYTARMSLM